MRQTQEEGSYHIVIGPARQVEGMGALPVVGSLISPLKKRDSSLQN